MKTAMRIDDMEVESTGTKCIFKILFTIFVDGHMFWHDEVILKQEPIHSPMRDENIKFIIHQIITALTKRMKLAEETMKGYEGWILLRNKFKASAPTLIDEPPSNSMKDIQLRLAELMGVQYDGR